MAIHLKRESLRASNSPGEFHSNGVSNAHFCLLISLLLCFEAISQIAPYDDTTRGTKAIDDNEKYNEADGRSS